jgi:hypothetical protein
MKKNDYINTLLAHHAALCPSWEHEKYRGAILSVAHFCQQSAMPIEEAKTRLEKVIEERRKL